ncbi:MAG TPA: hypothetical protein QGF58_29010 [Myxococcota bacterium]|nr:hypothetical protein [Myxococcota bacterium]
MILAFAGVLPDPGGRFVGEAGTDLWGTQWFYWRVGARVLDGEPFAHTNLLFYPWGKEVYLHTGGNVLDAALALPVRFAVGPVLGYDLFALGVLLVNGLATALLARRLGASAGASGVAALIGAFNPFTLGELAGGRPTQALIAFAVMAVSAFLSLDERASWRRGLEGGVWLVLAGLTYWYAAIFVVLVLAAALPAALLRARRRDELGALCGAVALGLGASLVLVLPLAWPMLGRLTSGEVPGLLPVDDWTLAGWSPVTVEGLEIGLEALHPRGTGVVLHWETDAGLSVVPERVGLFWTEVVLLAGLVLSRRRAMFLPMLGAAWILATGPQLPLFDVVDPIYVGLARVLPPLERLWWPARALFLVHLLAAVGAAALWRRAGRWRGALGLLVVAGLGFEARAAGWLPLPTAPADVPGLHRCLAGGDGALLEVPLDGEPRRLHYQAVHGRPLLVGMIDNNPVLAPAEHRAFREQSKLLGALEALDGRALDVGADRAELVELGFEYVLVYVPETLSLTEAAPEAALQRERRRVRAALDALLGRPVYDAEDMLLYPLAESGDPCEGRS